MSIQQTAEKICDMPEFHSPASLGEWDQTLQDSRARLAGLARQLESGLASRARRALERLADFFSIQLESPCLAVPWIPPLGSPVLVKVDAVPYTTRVPSQKLVVPYFASGGKLADPLGVTESASVLRKSMRKLKKNI